MRHILIPERDTLTNSAYSWFRLAVALLLSSIGGVGMWSMVAALPAAQVQFGIARGDASLPYSFCMIGFAFGGVLLGRVADRFGVMPPVLGGAVSLTLGYLAAGFATTFWQLALVVWPADRIVRMLCHVRAAAGGRVALVRPAPRPRGDDLRLRQLCRRRVLAARGGAFHRPRSAGGRRISVSPCSAP